MRRRLDVADRIFTGRACFRQMTSRKGELTMKYHRVQAMGIYATLISLLMASSAWAQSSVSLDVEPADGGYVAQFPGADELVDGGEVTVTATPADGYEFVGWEGDIETTASSFTFILSGDTALTAVFQPVVADVTYLLTAYVEPSGAGTIVRDPALFEYPEGAEVTLTAYADEGFVFAGWTGDLPAGTDASDPVLVVTMDGDVDIRANYSAGLRTDDETPGTAACGATGFASLGLLFGMMMMMKLGRSRG